MTDFENNVIQALTDSLVRTIQGGGFVNPNYSNRMEIPKSLIDDCWSMVDMGVVKEQVAQIIEETLAERIVNSIASEVATDIKQVLSVKERREAIRHLARTHLESIMSAGNENHNNGVSHE